MRLRESQSGFSGAQSQAPSLSRPSDASSNAMAWQMSTPAAYSSSPASRMPPGSEQHHAGARALTWDPSLGHSSSNASVSTEQLMDADDQPTQALPGQPSMHRQGSLPGSEHTRSASQPGAWDFLGPGHPELPVHSGSPQEEQPDADLRRISSSVGSSSGHYNPRDSVVARIEHLNERSMKAVIVRIPQSHSATLLCCALARHCPALQLACTQSTHAPHLLLLKRAACSSQSLQQRTWQSLCCWWSLSRAPMMPSGRCCATTRCGASTWPWALCASWCSAWSRLCCYTACCGLGGAPSARPALCLAAALHLARLLYGRCCTHACCSLRQGGQAPARAAAAGSVPGGSASVRSCSAGLAPPSAASWLPPGPACSRCTVWPGAPISPVACRKGQKWSGRRAAHLAVTLVEAAGLWLALALWLPLNLRILSGRCAWFERAYPGLAYASGICWQTVIVGSVVRPAGSHNRQQCAHALLRAVHAACLS